MKSGGQIKSIYISTSFGTPLLGDQIYLLIYMVERTQSHGCLGLTQTVVFTWCYPKVLHIY
jgi:hypothetical protein